jgi:hypothetical protein
MAIPFRRSWQAAGSLAAGQTRRFLFMWERMGIFSFRDSHLKTARGAGNCPRLSFQQLPLSNYQNTKRSSPLMRSSLLEQLMPLLPDLTRRLPSPTLLLASS